MKFISSRNHGGVVLPSEAIIRGIAEDGGLYVPESFPYIYEELKANKKASYEDLAFNIIKKFFDDIDEEELRGAIDAAYKGRLGVKVVGNFLELYHGPTSAFKDAALLFLPQIMVKAKNKCKINEEIVILTATSGDTGKAALEGFRDVEGFKVVVYYPSEGVSAIQEKQMTTQKGQNVKVVGIDGNFDHAQKAVKEIFTDKAIGDKLKKKGILLSSANSINIGRLVPQIVYYFYGYFSLINEGKIKEDEKINVVVPTGNFGNILAAYYAKQMGLPVKKFICASNENNVLADFFQTGTYDRKRDLKVTESPSMDILVSSNLERLLFEANGRDSGKVRNLMNDLQSKGEYKLTNESKEFLDDFYGDYAEIEEVYEAIKKLYEEENYLMDTHTAVAYAVLEKYRHKTGDNSQYLLASTASPYKFPRSICKALELDIDGKDDFEILDLLKEYTSKPIPENLKKLDKQPVLHKTVAKRDQLLEPLLEFLGE